MDYEGDCTDLDSNLDEEPSLPPDDDSLVPKVATINLSALTQNATEMRCQKETDTCRTSLYSVWSQTIWRVRSDHWHSEIILEGFDPMTVRAQDILVTIYESVTR